MEEKGAPAIFFKRLTSALWAPPSGGLRGRSDRAAPRCQRSPPGHSHGICGAADQLGDHVIKNGGSLTLTGIPCDEYDVKLVDEDGDECIVEAVDVCGEDDEWLITDDDLLECEGY